MSTLTSRDNKKKEKALMKQAELNEALAKQDELIGDVGSYESFRDAYRFMSRLTLIACVLGLLVNAGSFAVYLTKDKPKTYVTTTHGKVVEIKPYKID